MGFPMKALVDADIVAFRVAASTENESYDEMDYRVNSSMEQILSQCNATEFEAYLTGKGNFRYNIYPEYKANRRDKARPKWLPEARQILIDRWGAVVCEGYEADDALGMGQDKETNGSVICSIDKDLDQIPGLHFNWVKGAYYEVSEIEGIRRLYKQCLVGDRADNIIGIAGIGPVKADRIINPLDDEDEMDEVVRNLYDSEERYCINLQCLYIWR